MQPVSDEPGQDAFSATHWRQSPVTGAPLGALGPGEPEAQEFRLLADNLPSLCWIADGSGYIHWYSRRWHEYCGTTPADMAGWGWQSVHDPAVLPAVMARWEACIGAGEAFEMTFPLRGADGVFRPFLTRVTPLRAADGGVVRWFGNNTDLSVQSRTAAALRESEAYVRLLMNSSAEAFCAVDRGGVLTLCNATFLALMGLGGEHEVLGRALEEVVRARRADGAGYGAGESPILRCAAGGLAAHVDDEAFLRADGVAVPVEYWVKPIIVDGERRGAVCSFFDVTARRAAEERLRALNADLERQVLERSSERGRTWAVSPHLLTVIDLADGRILQVNPAWTATLGWDEAELTDRGFIWMVHPDDVAAVGPAWARLQAGEAVVNFENRYRTKDGRYRWLSWVCVPAQGRLYSSAWDVTVQKEQAAALELTQEALRQSQKMEAVGQLTGGLAHDFNNLLTGITGSLELLQTRVAQGRVAEVDRYVTAAQGAARRAAALTHRLLAFSRRQTLEPKAVDVNRLVAGMEELIGRTMGPEITIEPVAGVGLWTTLVDPGQLENALLNLCINARDAMPGGGRLTIETANRWLDARAASERDMAPGQYVSLCVSDNGTGMSAEVAARAFDPFFTTKPIGQGTGLGLSMIYGFVRQSGGQVRIYSEVGQGTMVCLYLPRHFGAAAVDVEAVGGVVPRAEQGETVLVVDDEATVRMLVVEVLEDLGYRAIEAGDGAGGLRVLETDVRVDLLVTDVGLPGGMNGRQLADAARVFRPGLRVLFITGYAENAVLSHGHLEPGMQVLTKPFGMEALAGRIRGMIG